LPILYVMKPASGSITSRLVLTLSLIGGSAVLVAGGVAPAVAAGPVQLAMMTGAAVVVFTIASWYVSNRLVADPLRHLAQALTDVSESEDRFVRVEAQTRDDEVGLIVDSLNELLRRNEERARELREDYERNVRDEDVRVEERVVARTRELRESNERLQSEAKEARAANDVRSEALAEMTHELRTPMNGVMGMAELLLNTSLTPQQLGYTRTVLESSEDLLSLVNNMLDFSKIEAGQLDRLDGHPVSPRGCVERVSQLLVARAEMKGLTLSSECADDLPNAILGDGKRLRQVLINIIGNAVKFTERGTIVVRVTLVGQVGDMSTIRFEVVDTGIGVPEHLHGHVFEQFSQADRSTTRQFGGAGLGLTISKHLVELMGGEIGVISRPGVGSNFWFTIKGEHRRPATAADQDLSGVRVLVVGSGAGTDVRDQLTSCGGTAVAVDNAQGALAALSADVFDVILIDAKSQDGLVVGQALRASEATRSLPLVLVSTVERRKDELDAIGIDGSLQRPVERKELCACVAGLTGRLDVVLPSEDEDTTRPDGDEDIAGARVLVAEDHSVNRKVTMTLLETLKCRADIAVDGIEAVDAVQREAYDLVLLDCQMPKLDGYDAAGQIRSLEQQGKVRFKGPGHLPIVALTAHTSPAHRARSLESGMDDFVSKPFTLRVLRGVLRKWLAGQVDESSATAESMSETEHPRHPPTDGAPISEAAIEEILELDRLNGGGVFADFAGGFLQAVPDTLEQLRAAIREDDAVAIARSAHVLTGACRNVGAEPMAAVSQELEALAEDGTTDGSSALASQLEDHYALVKAALEARLEKHQNSHVVAG